MQGWQCVRWSRFCHWYFTARRIYSATSFHRLVLHTIAYSAIMLDAKGEPSVVKPLLHPSYGWIPGRTSQAVPQYEQTDSGLDRGYMEEDTSFPFLMPMNNCRMVFDDAVVTVVVNGYHCMPVRCNRRSPRQSWPGIDEMLETLILPVFNNNGKLIEGSQGNGAESIISITHLDNEFLNISLV